MGDDRPFVCSAPGCGQRFTNEDHLAVHKHKHEMTLKFGPARTDSVIIADQTPTPTRFLKNCEEVGLFHELASSFEHEFKKAADDDDRKQAPGPLDMSLPSTPDVKIKEEEPVEVDSSPPDSPASSPRSPETKEEAAPKPVVISTPTPTIVRPGSLPLHLGYDPLHPTLPSPTSVITQAPPANRQLGSPTGSIPLVVHLANGQAVPVLPGPPVQMPSVISLARPMSLVPNVPGIPGPPGGGSGSVSPSGLPGPSEAKMRLKATLTHQISSLNGSGGMVAGTASTMVSARPEQSQILIQHPDAPSPAQPQVSPAQPTPSTGGRRRRTVDEDPDERRQRFLERNRAAASRCRQKRKLWVSSLEKKAEELTSQNIQLSNEVTLLRNEVAQLKQLLLAHKDCPVTALQKKTQGYLAESPKESSEPTGSPAPVIQHSSVTGANGLAVRSAAEAVATSVLTQMAGQRTELGLPVPSHVIMTPQSQSAGR
ncbi:cyclic AMP-dependent transcription factor ATF-7 isoform X1 [Ornithorhynchus anatinus]|uniref:cyclic AMP-dependent transcription factor ATF-7 isoform X1 n=1 Tax=Ornithorhynchus anatinus TaxID=9258 RepID=UPI0010A86777|nr:cyclic AMP-dependent transcription factor ATF-7 isoform X1 [Ornithorhynchus anatinus]XP_028930077.1 cyclic AMP-dependent transcription factor ATF-7 isoform X1 [Ornithorhynchus anatinus]